MVGLYDDSHDLSPKVKLIFEVIAALIVIVYGEIYIKGFGYFPSDAMTFLSGIVTLFWIVGITNAINLIDGLDGLSAGISIIVLVTISMTSLLSGRSDIDTLIAILRRKIHHKKFSEADRGHLHHNLMFKLKLGQRKSVLVLYLVTFLFSLSSYLYYYNPTAGTILFIALMIMFEIFVEVTNMISRKYKPILTIVNIFIDSDKLPKIKFLDRYRKRRSPQKAMRDHLIIALCFLLMIVGVGYFMTSKDTPLPIKTETVQSPYTKSGDSELLNNIYARLDTSYKNKDEEDQLVAAYFACDYYTFVDKKKNEIGGVDYMYPEMVENFSQYAQTSFYSYKNQYPELEVLKYNIISYSPSKVTIAGLEDNDYYNILISLTFNEEIEGLNSTVNVTVVRVEDRYYVCGLDNA